MKKLIRDNIPGMPEEAWEQVCPVEAYDYLKEKLQEEIQELIDSEYKDIGEFCDVLEVLQTLAYINKISWKDVEITRKVKKKNYGGFSNKILKINEN